MPSYNANEPSGIMNLKTLLQKHLATSHSNEEDHGQNMFQINNKPCFDEVNGSRDIAMLRQKCSTG